MGKSIMSRVPSARCAVFRLRFPIANHNRLQASTDLDAVGLSLSRGSRRLLPSRPSQQGTAHSRAYAFFAWILAFGL
jgi:hypothetical protein